MFSWLSIHILEALHLFDRFIVPMRNGDLDSKGLLASIVRSEGTLESFKVRFLSSVFDTLFHETFLL